VAVEMKPLTAELADHVCFLGLRHVPPPKRGLTVLSAAWQHSRTAAD